MDEELARSRAGQARTAATYAVALLVLAGGAWGLSVPRSQHVDDHEHSSIATVSLRDGALRVEGVEDRQVGHVMPGMTLPDEAPAGMRRIAVAVTLAATKDRDLGYSRREFTVSGSGFPPVAPVAGQFDQGVLTAGRAISGSLTFEVPRDAASLSLRFRDAESVRLPDLPPLHEDPMPGHDPRGTQGQDRAEDHDHGDHGDHDDGDAYDHGADDHGADDRDHRDHEHEHDDH